MLLFNKKIDPILKDVLNRNLYSKHRVLIKYNNIKESIEKKIKSNKCKVIFNIESVNCLCAVLSNKAIKSIIELPEVKYVCLDELAFLCGKNVLLSNGVYTQGSKSELLSEKGFTGKGIGIGIIDSGVYPHPDLVNPTNKIKYFMDLVNNLSYPYDDNGHGTFISGVVSGSGTSGKAKDRGVAINSHIAMIKAFNSSGRGYISSTLYSLETLYGLIAEYNLKVICAPFEVITMNSFILDLYDKLFTSFKDKKVVVVVPSGHNEASEDTIKGIAISNKVLTIGGMNTHSYYSISPYSCCGSNKVLHKPDFMAASDNIMSLNSDISYVSERDGVKLYPHSLKTLYTEYSGTSISCAFIAGVCALLYEINSEYTYEDIYSLLKLNSILMNDKKYKQGNGYIKLYELLNIKK